MQLEKGPAGVLHDSVRGALSYCSSTWTGQGGCNALGHRHVWHETIVTTYLHLVLGGKLFLQAHRVAITNGAGVHAAVTTVAGIQCIWQWWC